MANTQQLPSTFRKIQTVELSSDFRKATKLLTFPFSLLQSDQLPTKSLLLKNLWVGINASDVNFTNGKYLPGVKPPFDAGFEGVARVVRTGASVQGFKEGDYVVFTTFGAFAEYVVVNSNACVKVPSPNPEFLPLLVSALTASLALEQVGDVVLPSFDLPTTPSSSSAPTSPLTILVTAAAGATGLFAVQLGILAGHRVIGTTSSSKKVDWMKTNLPGIHRVVNTKTEDLNQVLKKEYPQGVDVVYESVGGSIFDTCVNNLAVCGKLIVIGAISGYQDGSAWATSSSLSSPSPSTATQKAVTPLPSKLLARSASIRGFFLNHYAVGQARKRHMDALSLLVSQGKLRSFVDRSAGAQFKGLEEVPNAIDYLFRGENIGKVIVNIDAPSSSPSSPSARL